MSMMVLIRPGATALDEQHRVIGSLELLSDPTARNGVLEAAEGLADLPVSTVLSCSRNPCGTMARMLGDKFDWAVRFSDALGPVNLGLWEGQHVSEVQRKYPKTFRQWLDLEADLCPPNGESVCDVIRRVEKVMNRAISKQECFVVVAGEPLASVLLCHVGKLPRRAACWTSPCEGSEIDVVELASGRSSWFRPRPAVQKPAASPLDCCDHSVIRLHRQGNNHP